MDRGGWWEQGWHGSTLPPRTAPQGPTLTTQQQDTGTWGRPSPLLAVLTRTFIVCVLTPWPLALLTWRDCPWRTS